MAKGLTLTSKPKGTLSAYEPSLRDNLAWMLSDLVGGDRGTTNYINEKVKGAADFIPGVGDAVGFDEAKRDFDAGNYGQAAFGAATSAVGSIPGAGDLAAAGLKGAGSALGILMGPMSRTWNDDALRKAMDMQYDKQSPTQIWKETGTAFNPKSEEWVQEIPDTAARVHPSRAAWGHFADDVNLDEIGFSTDLMNPDMMEDVLTHPAFFEAYPGARGIGVHDPAAVGEMTGLGAFMQTNPKLSREVDGGLPEYTVLSRTRKGSTGDPRIDAEIDPRGTMLHELQHWVQVREGTEPGFNPEAAYSTGHRPGSFLNSVYGKAKDEMFSRMRTPEELQKWGEFGREAAFETYMRSVGEAEARNVGQIRSKFDADQLKQIAPVFSQDRRFNEQLTIDDILNGIYDRSGVPGLSLRGPAKRLR